MVSSKKETKERMVKEMERVVKEMERVVKEMKEETSPSISTAPPQPESSTEKEKMKRMVAQMKGIVIQMNGIVKTMEGMMEPMEGKVFNDPIHGHMEFHPFLVKIIDTPQFQRLRDLRQLGAYFVYPGASHNRFEHSLGVAHLAGEFARSLKVNQPELGINDRDILCVEIAGLCHDLGHGPFSHMFDKVVKDTKWEHEEASVKMFENIVEKLKDNGFDLEADLNNLKMEDEKKEDDLKFIKEMITGQKEMEQCKGRQKNKHFLYEIVANKRNGIDVDKFDYFARDCHHLGIKSSFDHRRYIQFARVCEVKPKIKDPQTLEENMVHTREICIRDKELHNVYEMFHTRSRLHQKAYQHKTTKVIEYMITEAFIKAKEKVGISKAIIKDGKVDVEEYTKLTDDIFGKILHSSESELEEARDILKKVVSRKIYRRLGKAKMTTPPEITEEMKKDWEEELAETYHNDKTKRKEDYFVIIITSFDFGKKNKNPIDDLYFYSKFDKTKAFKIPEDQVSGFLKPENYSEKWIHVYCKKPEANMAVAKRSFIQWCQTKDFIQPPPLEEGSSGPSTSQ